METTVTIGLAFNGITLFTVLLTAFKFGRFLQRFEDVEKLAQLHEQQLAPRRKIQFDRGK